MILAWYLQADPWYVVLRDITVILAAASIVLSSLFLGLVGWQLWRPFHLVEKSISSGRAWLKLRRRRR